MTEEEINKIIEDIQGKNGHLAQSIAKTNIKSSLEVIPKLRAYIKTLEEENLRLFDELRDIKSNK
jgi:hypothetical protein